MTTIMYQGSKEWVVAEDARPEQNGALYPTNSAHIGPVCEPKVGDWVFLGCSDTGWKADLEKRGLKRLRERGSYDEIMGTWDVVDTFPGNCRTVVTFSTKSEADAYAAGDGWKYLKVEHVK